MKINKRSLIRWKIYIDRSRMYVGYINMFMIVTVFVKAIQNTGPGQFLVQNGYYTIPALFILFFIFSLFLGYLDSRLGIRKEELRNLAQANPVQMEILKTLRDIRQEQLKDANKN